MLNQPKSALSAIIGSILLAGCSSSFVIPNQNLIDPEIRKVDGWKLIWNDEFNGTEIDNSKWLFEENCWGGGNNEQQCYTSLPKNSFVQDGVLYIVAYNETFVGPDNVDNDYTSLKTLPYTSARLSTKEKGDWTYGRFEVRAKMPSGQGTWPAIWMLPTDFKYGTWAASGEIDIFEAVNLKASSDSPDFKGQPESRIYGTLHYGAAWPNNKHSGQPYYLPNNQNPADDFHTYSIEWEEGEIRWYVDDVHYATQTSDGWYALHSEDGKSKVAPSHAPFNARFHLLLNLAVGGSWAANTNEKGVDSSIFPQALEVDYVRVYECALDPVSGKGCATVSKQASLVKGVQPPLMIDLPSNFTSGQEITIFDGQLSQYMQQHSYDPQGVNINFSYLSDEQRGQVMQVEKKAAIGNVYFESPEVDLSAWGKNAKIVFDIKMLEVKSGSEISVKIDSGWPTTSDLPVKVPNDNKWHTIEIDIAELLENGNSFAAGSVNMSRVKNILVLDPLGEMKFKLDNVRFERY